MPQKRRMSAARVYRLPYSLNSVLLTLQWKLVWRKTIQHHFRVLSNLSTIIYILRPDPVRSFGEYFVAYPPSFKYQLFVCRLIRKSISDLQTFSTYYTCFHVTSTISTATFVNAELRIDVFFSFFCYRALISVGFSGHSSSRLTCGLK